MSKYLDNDGVLYLWQKLKAIFATKANVSHNHAASEITSGTLDSARLPTASASVLGGVKVGTNLSISDGVLSATDTTYSAATTSAAGLMSAADKTKLDGIDTGANAYTHPTFTSKSSGLYKITVNGEGHVSAATAVAKSDITSLGIPGQDTTVSYDTMFSDDTEYVVPVVSQTSGGNVIALGGSSVKYYTGDPESLVVEGEFPGDMGVLSAPAFSGKLNASDLYIGTVPSARLPMASASVLGAVKVGTNLSINQNGVLSATDTTYSNATTSAAGLMSSTDKAKLDGLSIGTSTQSGQRVINLSYTNGAVEELIDDVSVPNATTSSPGMMSAADKAKLDGIATGANAYTLPTASDSTLGGIKVGTNLSIDANGVLSADAQAVSPMTGATASTAGAGGTVPAPAAGDQLKVLTGNGNWSAVTLDATEGTPVGGGTGTRSVLLKIGTNQTSSLPFSSLLASSTFPGFMASADKTKLDGFSAASNYALKTDITSMYKHKGSVATTNDLPATGNTEGDVYNVTATGMNYVWVVTNNTGAWDALGEVFTITSITNAEIDTILAS